MPGALINEALRALSTRVIISNAPNYELHSEEDEIEDDAEHEILSMVNTKKHHVNYLEGTTYSIEQCIQIIEDEAKDLCKSMEEYEALSGLERLQKWTNAQPKHLFIG